MKPVAVDFETIGDPRLIPFMKEPTHKKGTVKEDIKKRQIEDKKAIQIADMSKKPVYNKIICAGFYDGVSSKSMILPHEGNTQSFLKGIWDYLKLYDYYITFNGREFDFRTLIMNSVREQVEQTVRIGFERYRVSNHFDVRDALGFWDNRAEGTMDFFIKAFGLPGGKQGVNGSMIAGLYANREYETIADYCANGDAIDTWNLWKYVIKYMII